MTSMAAVRTSPHSPSTLTGRSLSPIDPARIIKRLSDSRKAQVPYYTGWDTKPNSCSKLVAEIDTEEIYQKNVILTRACTVLAISQQRKRYSDQGQQQFHKRSPKNKIKARSVSPAAAAGGDANRTVTLLDYGRSTRQDEEYDHYRDFPDFPDDDEDDSSLSLHCYDSPSASQPSKVPSLSPSSFAQLNISGIPSDSSRGDASSFKNKSKSSLKSALSSSTPIKPGGTTPTPKKVHFADEEDWDVDLTTSSQGRKSGTGTFSILEEDELDEWDMNEQQQYQLEHQTKALASSTPNTSNQIKDEIRPSLYHDSPVHIEIQKSLDELERKRIEKWRDDVEAKAHEVIKSNSSSAAPSPETDKSLEQVKLLSQKCNIRRQNLLAKVVQQQKLIQLEFEKEDKQLQATQKLEAEERRLKLEKEKAEAEATALREQAKLQEIQKQEEQAQLKAKEEAAAAASEAQRRIQEEQLKAQEQKQLAEQQAQQQTEQHNKTTGATSNQNLGVPLEFRTAILQSDLSIYGKLQKKLAEIKEAIKEISSTNPRTKEFYFSAMKVVNTPINSISNLSVEHLQQKIQHFIQLLEGKPVYIGDSMRKPFVASAEPNGEIFIQNLLAFRFVKKSEAEITRGMSGLTPLANLGVQLIRRFPDIGILIRANFYKVCPFLVPLIYPRAENMTNEQYASILGHEQLGGTERTIQQVLLERLSGYCTLYGIMVNIVEKGQFSDIGPENLGFFSMKEVWRILVATMKLEPQVDVTSTVLQALLDTSCDLLYRTFRSQFRKLMNELSSKYLRKIRNITPPAQAASLTRLELFLEAQVPKLR